MTEYDLNKALNNIDERLIEEAEEVLGNRPSEKKQGIRHVAVKGNVRRRTLRVVLTAACVVVLLVGTVAASGLVQKVIENVRKQNGMVTLVGSQDEEGVIEEAVIPINQTVEIDDLTFTVENIIGDDEVVFAEISTNYQIDEPEGYVLKPVLGINISGKALFPEEETDYGVMNGLAQFCRDGKLWYMLTISYNNVDISHADMMVEIKGKWNDTQVDRVIEWKNDYEPKKETIAVNQQLGDYLITNVVLSTTRMELQYEIESVRTSGQDAVVRHKLLLDSIKLDDGTVLQYNEINGFMVQALGYASEDDTKTFGGRYFNLIGGFSTGGVVKVVPFERIKSIVVEGVEITIR